MRTPIACAVALILPHLVPNLLAEDVATAEKPEAKSILGIWECVSLERGGQQVPSQKVQSDRIRMEFGDGIMKATRADRDGERTVKYRLTTEESPAHLDFTRTNNGREQTTHGIYRIEDDTLTICLSRPGSERPTEFKTEAGKETALITLKRRKAGE